MNGSSRTRRSSITLYLVAFILLSNHITRIVADESKEGGAKKQERPSLAKIVTKIFSERLPPSSWEVIRSAIHQIQLKYFPPTLHFRGSGEGKGGAEDGGRDAGDATRKAAKKSFETSGLTVEESAKLAGRGAGAGVHKTAEKIKEKASNSDREESHSEL